MNPSNSLPQHLARELEADLPQLASESGILPAGRMLCLRYGVSRPTLLAAMGILSRSGKLVTNRGRRARLPRKKQPVAIDTRTAVESVASFIRERINDGTFATQHQLPKRAYFCGMLGVSEPTVSAAFRLLHRNNLAFRRGRHWHAGVNQDKPSCVVGTDRPAILLIQEYPHTWADLFESDRLRRFAQSLAAEAEKYGVQMILALADERQSDLWPFMPAGIQALSSAIRDLGARCRGSLILARHMDIPDLGGLIRALLGTGKPVVWFDEHDVVSPPRIRSRLYARCHYSAARAEITAIEALASTGHRKAVYLSPLTADDWAVDRGQSLQKRAEGFGVQIASLAESDWRWYTDGGGKNRLQATIEALRYTGLGLGKGTSNIVPDSIPSLWQEQQTRRSTFSRRLVRISPFLLAALSDPEVTALVAANDYAGMVALHWLRLLDVAVPDTISLVSFDNYPRSYSYQISSVDFGFGALGQAAFHFLFGVLPARRNRRGDIVASAFLEHRSTLGPPRKHPFALDDIFR